MSLYVLTSMAQGNGGMMIHLHIEARNSCPIHAPADKDFTKTSLVLRRSWKFLGIKKTYEVPQCDCVKPLVGISDNDYDIAITGFAGWVLNNILDTAQTIKDTGGTNRSLSANTAVSGVWIVAGSGVTAPAFSDTNLGTPLDNSTTAPANDYGAQTGVMGSIGTPSTGFQVTATITNNSGINQTYGEVGILNQTATPYYFLITHDQTNGGSGYVVSNNGTVAVTYSITFS